MCRIRKSGVLTACMLAAVLVTGCGNNDNIRDLESDTFAENTTEHTEDSSEESIDGQSDADGEQSDADGEQSDADGEQPDVDDEQPDTDGEPSAADDEQDAASSDDAAEDSDTEPEITEEMCMEQYSAVIFSFATGSEYVVDYNMAIYYGESISNGEYQTGAFAFYDIDSDGLDELLLSCEDPDENGNMKFCSVYKGSASGSAEFVTGLYGVTPEGLMVSPYSDSSVDIDFKVGHLKDGEFVAEAVYSEKEDGSEAEIKNGDEDFKPMDTAEFDEVYSKYFDNFIPISGYVLTLKNYEKVFGEELYEVEEVVVKTTDGGVNVRTGPGTEYDIIYSMVPDGVHFWVFAYTDSTTGKPWGRVRFEGREGWISMSQVEYVD